MSEPEQGPLCKGCVFPAVAVVTVGCEHEHVTEIPVCLGRIEYLEQSRGHLACAACQPLHGDCFAMVSVTWPDGREDVIQQAGDAMRSHAMVYMAPGGITPHRGWFFRDEEEHRPGDR